MVAAFAFKIEYGINHMFQYPGTCNGSLFGDMSYQEKRKPFAFGQFYQFIRTGTNLGDTAGRRLNFVQVHRLNGIDYDHRRIGFFKRRDNIFNIGGTGEFNRGLIQPQTFSPNAHLVNSFFPGYIVNLRQSR